MEKREYKKQYYHMERWMVPSFVAYAVIIAFLMSVIFNALYVKEQNGVLAVRENSVLEVFTQVEYFLLESVDTVKMTAYTVNSLLEEGAGDDEILDYLAQQTKAYKKTMSSDFTGVYGAIRGKFLDGSGWTPPEGFVFYERPWYLAAMEGHGEVTLVTPYLDTKTQTIMMSVCKMLPDQVNVISMDVTMNDIQKAVEESVANDGWLQSMILDANGIVVAHSDQAELGKKYLEEADSLQRRVASAIDVNEEAYFDIDYQGKKYYVFTDEIMNGWKAVTILEASELMAPLKRISYIFFAVLFMILCSMAFIFWRIYALRRRQWDLLREIKVLAGVFEKVWLIDLAKDSYVEGDPVAGTVAYGEPVRERAQYSLRSILDDVTDERFKKSVYDFIDFSLLPRRLKGRTSLTLEYLNTKNAKCRIRFIPVRWGDEGTPETVLWSMEVEEERMD